MPLIVNSNNEFFISLAKTGIHSFMMLGVIQNDGAPKLLARVGKAGFDPDVHNLFQFGYKASLGNGVLTRLHNEGVTRRADFSETISHQSYSLTYAQAKQCLELIYDAEQAQFANSDVLKGYVSLVRDAAQEEVVKYSDLIKAIDSDKDMTSDQSFNDILSECTEDEQATDLAAKKAKANVRSNALQKKINNETLIAAIDRDDRQFLESENFKLLFKKNRISAYMPSNEDDLNNVEFNHYYLDDWYSREPRPAPSPKVVEDVFSTENKLTLNNTCRITALNMVELILGFKTNISRNFLISPKYQVTMTGGSPDKDTFYILPPPPSSYPHLANNKHQMSVINSCYAP